MKVKKPISLLLAVVMAAQFAGFYARAYTPTPASIQVTVQYVISDLYKAFGFSVPSGHTAADVRDSSGAKPGAAHAAAVSYAKSRGWLPESIPSFASAATAEFTLTLGMAMTGYKNMYASTEFDAVRKEALEAVRNDLLADGGVSRLSQALTPATYDKIVAIIERREIPRTMNSMAYGASGAKDYDKAVFLFDMITGSIESHNDYKAYKANAYLGLGQIYSTAVFMMYDKAADCFQNCIRLDASGQFGTRAKSDMEALPDFALSRSYKNGDDVTYQEFVAMTQHYMFYAKQSGDTLSDDTTDAKGAQPADYALAAAQLAGPGSSREFYATKPTSWSDPVPRWWAAEYICKMRGSYNFSIVNVYPYEDTYGLSPEKRMYLSRAVELGYLYAVSASQAGPDGVIKRGDVYGITQRMYNPAAPEFEEHPNGLEPKVHAYYTGTLGTDADLDVFGRSKADMVTFLFTWFEKPSGEQLTKEGTKVMASLFINETEYTAFRLDAMEAAADAGCEKYYGFSILNGVSGDKEAWDYLISCVKDDKKLADLCSDLAAICKKYGFDGVNLGLEFIGASVPITMAQHTKLAEAMSKALRKEGLKLIVSVGAVPRDSEMYASNMFYDYEALGRAADYVHLLTYDDTSVSRYADTGVPGAVSGLERITRCVKYALYSIPREKLLMGFGTYCIDYTLGTKSAENITYAEMQNRADRTGTPPPVQILNDNGEDGPYREYTDDNGRKHRVAFDNKESFSNRMKLVYGLGLGGVSYYWMGAESKDFNDAVDAVFNRKYARPVSEAAGWAQGELTKAIGQGFVPDYLQSAYKQNITRNELFDLLRNVAGQLDKDTSYDQSKSFADSAAPASLWASKAGITATAFESPISPLRAITRQETAVTMARVAAKLFGKNADGAPQTAFADQRGIAGWAANEINYINSVGVMSGNSRNEFAPQGMLSREEAIIMALRFYEAMK